MLGLDSRLVTRWPEMAMADYCLHQTVYLSTDLHHCCNTLGMADAQMLLGALAALTVAGVAAGSLYARQYFAGRKHASKDPAQEEPRRDLRRKRGCSTPLPCHAPVMLCMLHHKLHDVNVQPLSGSGIQWRQHCRCVLQLCKQPSIICLQGYSCHPTGEPTRAIDKMLGISRNIMRHATGVSELQSHIPVEALSLLNITMTPSGPL